MLILYSPGDFPLKTITFVFFLLSYFTIVASLNLVTDSSGLSNATLKSLGEQIELFMKKLCFAQWKRERFAISFRVTSFDLDPKNGFRFPPIQTPFTVELKEMWEWIEAQ